MNIQYNKYKRLFTVGCSFTSYLWPTWANIIAAEMPTAEHINIAKAGAGNLFISSMIAQANRTYSFSETDLVMVMWSSFCREDRWVNGVWVTGGNVFFHQVYSPDWVKQFSDPTGYLIRDMALIELSSEYLKNLPCDSIMMPMVPMNDDIKIKTPTMNKIETLYGSKYRKMPLSFYEAMQSWPPGHTYSHHMGSTAIPDGHPSPNVHCSYLRKIGIPLTNTGILYASQSTSNLEKTSTVQEIQKLFPELIASTVIL